MQVRTREYSDNMTLRQLVRTRSVLLASRTLRLPTISLFATGCVTNDFFADAATMTPIFKELS